MKSQKEWEYCAVNAYGWAFADDMLKAMDMLWDSYSNEKGGYTSERAEKTLLRVYKFPKGNRPRFRFYMPEWDEAGVKYWVVYDNMADAPAGTFPMQFTYVK